jgi:hypothetical protein
MESCADGRSPTALGLGLGRNLIGSDRRFVDLQRLDPIMIRPFA